MDLIAPTGESRTDQHPMSTQQRPGRIAIKQVFYEDLSFSEDANGTGVIRFVLPPDRPSAQATGKREALRSIGSLGWFGGPGGVGMPPPPPRGELVVELRGLCLRSLKPIKPSSRLAVRSGAPAAADAADTADAADAAPSSAPSRPASSAVAGLPGVPVEASTMRRSEAAGGASPLPTRGRSGSGGRDGDCSMPEAGQGREGLVAAELGGRRSRGLDRPRQGRAAERRRAASVEILQRKGRGFDPSSSAHPVFQQSAFPPMVRGAGQAAALGVSPPSQRPGVAGSPGTTSEGDGGGGDSGGDGGNGPICGYVAPPATSVLAENGGAGVRGAGPAAVNGRRSRGGGEADGVTDGWAEVARLRVELRSAKEAAQASRVELAMLRTAGADVLEAERKRGDALASELQEARELLSGLLTAAEREAVRSASEARTESPFRTHKNSR